MKQRANDLVQALNFFFQLNEGSTITDLLGGRYDFSQFKGRLDVSKAAVVGHSFGGGSTIRVLTEEPRFMYANGVRVLTLFKRRGCCCDVLSSERDTIK